MFINMVVCICFVNHHRYMFSGIYIFFLSTFEYHFLIVMFHLKRCSSVSACWGGKKCFFLSIKYLISHFIIAIINHWKINSSFSFSLSLFHC